jgi:5-methylcytosine-specific restriction protein B
MSQPDEIRKFVLNHYVLPARERGEDTITLSVHSIQQAIGSEVAVEKICKALDTRLFLNQAIVTLIRREGSPQAADAQWTFGVSMRRQRGEVLVAVVKRKGDLAIVEKG